MKTSQRGVLVEHLSEAELDHAIENAQKAGESRLVRRLCYVKNLRYTQGRGRARRDLSIHDAPVGPRLE
jgi:hypothetical protein